MPDIPILGHHTLPDGSGNIFFEPTAAKFSNDRWPYGVWIFNNSGSVRISLFGSFKVPQNFASGATLKITWTTSATANEVVWDFDYRCVGGNDAESLDQTTQQEQVTVTDTAPSAAFEQMIVTIALTDSNFAAGDTVQFEFARDKADAADDLAAAAILHDLEFSYTAS